jgi:hypothetical protein
MRLHDPYLSNLSGPGQFASIPSLILSVLPLLLLLPLSVLFLLLVSSHPLQPLLPFFKQLFSLHSRSQLSLFLTRLKRHSLLVWFKFLLGRRKRRETCSWTCNCCRQFWEEEGSPSLSLSLSLHSYSILNEVGCLGLV